MNYVVLSLRSRTLNFLRHFIRAKISFRESPRKSDHGESFRGHSRTKTVLGSPRHRRGLFAVYVSPQNSMNNPAADIRGLSYGITDNFHNLLRHLLPNLLPNVRGFAFSQIYTCPRKSAAGLFTDFRGLTWTAKCPRECRRLSRTVLVPKSPRSDFSRSDFRGKGF